MRAARFVRWKVTAKRCASSRACCSRRSAGERRGRRTPSAATGQEDLLVALGEADDRAGCDSPSSCSASTAALSCPLPPSITTRSGSGFSSSTTSAQEALHDLVHRLEVVDAGGVANGELAVLAALGRPFSNQTHEATVSVPCACEMSKQTSERGSSRQAELPLQFVHRIGRPLVGLERGELELLEQVTRVLVGEIHELAPRPALRHAHVRSPPAPPRPSPAPARRTGAAGGASAPGAVRYHCSRNAASTAPSSISSACSSSRWSRASSLPPRIRSTTAQASSPSRA